MCAEGSARQGFSAGVRGQAHACAFWRMVTSCLGSVPIQLKEDEGVGNGEGGGMGPEQWEGDGPGPLSSRPQDQLWILPPEGKPLNVGKPPQEKV